MRITLTVERHEFTIIIAWRENGRDGYGYEIVGAHHGYRSVESFGSEYEAVMGAIHHLFPALKAAAS